MLSSVTADAGYSGFLLELNKGQGNGKIWSHY